MRELEQKFAGGVVRFRWWIIVISLILVALAASGVRHLTVTNSYRVYFGPDDPHRVAYEYLEKVYTKDDSVMFVFAPKNGEIFTREFLPLLESFTESAWQLPYSSRVDSITNFQHTEASGDDLIVADLIRDASNFSDAELERVKSIALAEPRLVKLLLAEDARVAAINVNIRLPGIDEAQELPFAVKAARDLAAEFMTMNPEVKVYISGMTPFHNSVTEAAVNDLTKLGPISLGVMFFLLVILAGGLIGTLTTIMVILLSVTGAMGMSGYLGFPITPTGAGAPNIILTVAVANSVHILISYFHELREGIPKHKAIEESLRININPISLASITTAIGFMSMNFSEAPPFQQMGTTIAIGVIFSFGLSITFLPALLAILPTGRIRHRSMEDNWVSGLGDFVVRRRRGLLWGMSALIIAVVANVPRNEINDRFYQIFDETYETRVAMDFVLDNLTGIYVVNYSLDSGEPGGIAEPEFLRLAHGFTEWWRAQPETEHVSSITDTMKRLNKNMHGDDDAMYKLPDSRELAAQYLLLYEMSLPYGLDLNNEINVDKSATRVIATLQGMSMKETLDITRRAEMWLDEHAPSIGYNNGSGMVMMFTHLMRSNVVTMITGTTVALGLISFVIMMALRSVKIGALSIITNMAPIGMGFGIWGMLSGEIGMALSMVVGMTFGIVVDDTVHFLSKYLRARREQGMSPEEAVKYAFKTVGRALIVTSIVLVAGFLVLSTSHFSMNANMGLAVAIVIACALFTVLLFLPPLLMKLEKHFGGDAARL